MANIDDYIQQLRTGVIKNRIRIEWLRKDETVERINESDIISGSISINRNNGIRRTITVELPLTKDLLPNIYGVWVNKKFKVWIGVYVNGNTDIFWSEQGTFVLSNPTYTVENGGGTITINGTDKFCLLNGENGSGTLKDIYQVDMGSDVNQVLKQILAEFNEPKSPMLDPLSKTFPYDIRKSYGDSIGDMIQDIAYFCARNVYFNKEGHFRFEDDKDDETKGSIWNFNSELDKLAYMGNSLESRFNDLRNVVKIVAENVNGNLVTATAKDENLASETNIYRIGEIPEVIVNNIIQTEADALALAQYILKRKVILTHSSTINCTPIMVLDVDRVITITDRYLNFDKKRFLITGITMGLGFGDVMSMSLVDVDEIDYTIGSF